MGFPTAADRADRTAGTSLNPLPYQAWHGYRATNADRVEVEVCAAEHASAPPSPGADVADAPPSGAFYY
jgi:hypothetical protein